MVYNSKAVSKFCETEGLSFITLPRKSPDFSILETMARIYKQRFYAERDETEAARLARFEKIFNKEVAQEKI